MNISNVLPLPSLPFMYLFLFLCTFYWSLVIPFEFNWDSNYCSSDFFIVLKIHCIIQLQLHINELQQLNFFGGVIPLQ